MNAFQASRDGSLDARPGAPIERSEELPEVVAGKACRLWNQAGDRVIE